MITASDYILSLFYPDDLLAIMTMRNGETPNHRFAKAKEVASTVFMDSLRKQNEAGCNIYVCMNPLSGKRRVKENVSNIRTLYLDIDQNGTSALDRISKSTLVPRPHFTLQSSPNKFQVIWVVGGIQPDEQERLLDSLIQEFGGDPAASDKTRVLRLPGFVNHKYDAKPVVEIIESNFNGEDHTAADFKVTVAPFKPAEKTPAVIEEGERNARLASLAGKLRREGFNEEEILASLRAVNPRCINPLSDAEVAAIAKSISRYAPAKTVESRGDSSQAETRPDMSRSVLSGRLGEICEKNMLGDFPVAYAWPSLVTAASVLVPERANYAGGDNLHNLYTALVGPVNFGKSQAIEWAMKLLRVQDDPRQYSEVKAGSAERLLIPI